MAALNSNRVMNMFGAGDTGGSKFAPEPVAEAKAFYSKPSGNTELDSKLAGLQSNVNKNQVDIQANSYWIPMPSGGQKQTTDEFNDEKKKEKPKLKDSNLGIGLLGDKETLGT